MSRLLLTLLTTGMLLASFNLQAEKLFTVRSPVPFEQALATAESLVADYGYKAAHLQRCDGGLKDFGYKSDFYRILFFGKLDEVRQLSDKNPQIVPFLPLKMLIFAENDETVLVAVNPLTLSPYFDDESVQLILRRWKNDIESIFDEMRHLKKITE